MNKGVVSDAFTGTGYPKHIWTYDGTRVFEATYGGSVEGAYHGYPIRKSDPLFDDVVDAWNKS